MKTAEREQARVLRREQGQSIKQIAAALDVSTSSVSLWVRDIELTDEQLDALRLRNQALNGQRVGARVRSTLARGLRLGAQEGGRRLARRADALHAAGCMLFWAEGSRARNAVKFSNSDPVMMEFFIRFLRAYFEIAEARFRVWCNLHADHALRQREVEDFWLGTLALPRSCLTKSTVNVYSRATRRKRTNMLPYGTCRLTVHDTAVVQHIYGAIQEYAGFEREEWLDCLPRAS
ncbi:MAG: helix-turn-helix domain-containing protein [Actinomycetota bacterium]|nr:helix-turn-helix domain-containing protein [Actinomycetota bacterium]